MNVRLPETPDQKAAMRKLDDLLPEAIRAAYRAGLTMHDTRALRELSAEVGRAVDRMASESGPCGREDDQ